MPHLRGDRRNPLRADHIVAQRCLGVDLHSGVAAKMETPERLSRDAVGNDIGCGMDHNNRCTYGTLAEGLTWDLLEGCM